MIFIALAILITALVLTKLTMRIWTINENGLVAKTILVSAALCWVGLIIFILCAWGNLFEDPSLNFFNPTTVPGTPD